MEFFFCGRYRIVIIFIWCSFAFHASYSVVKAEPAKLTNDFGGLRTIGYSHISMKVPKILWHSKISSWVTVTILAGRELTFFTEALMMPWFWFLMMIVMLIHWYLGCWWAVLTQNHGLFSFSCCPANEELSVHKELGMDRTRTDVSDLIKGHSYHVVSCWTIKAGIKKGKGGGSLGMMAFVFLRQFMHMNSLLCFVHAAFTLHSMLALEPTSSHAFIPVLSLIPFGEGMWVAARCWADAGVKPQHFNRGGS